MCRQKETTYLYNTRRRSINNNTVEKPYFIIFDRYIWGQGCGDRRHGMIVCFSRHERLSVGWIKREIGGYYL